MPAFETRLTSLGKLQKYPKIHVGTGEESSSSDPDSTQGLRPRHRREWNPERPPRNSHGDWPFLRAPERVQRSPSERIPGVPVTSQEEALSTGKARGTPESYHHSKSPPEVSVHSRGTCFPCTASTVMPRIDSHDGGTWDSPVGKPRGNASKERERIPGVPVTSQEEALSTGKARGTPESYHHSKSPPEVSVHSRGTCFPCTASTVMPRIDSHDGGTWDSPVGKPRGNASKERETIPGVPVASQEEALSTGKARGTPESYHHSKSPPEVSVHSRGTCFPCTASTVMPRIDSHDGGTWDSPVGKPRGKASKERHRRERNYEWRRGNSHGDWPFLRRRERVPEGPVKNPKIHVSTGVESSLSGPDSTQGLIHRQGRERNPERPPSNSHGDWPFLRSPERVPEVPIKNPKIHVSTGVESSLSGPDSTQGLIHRQGRERNPERPPSNSHGDWPFLRSPERVPEVPIGRNSRHSRRISRGGALHRKGERNSRVVPPFQESPRCVSPFQRNLFSLHCLEFHTEHRLTPRWHVGQPCGKASWESLVEEPKIHVSTGVESSLSGPDSTQGLIHRQGRERNPERPPSNSHGDWPFLRSPERVPEVPIGRNSRHSRRISRGGALHRKGERNSRVVPPFQESPRCVSPFQRNLFSLHCLEFHTEHRLTPRWHVGQPCGKASWESLVEEPKIHVSTGVESSLSGPDSTQGLIHRQGRERNPERPPSNSHGDWPFLRSPERVPEVPIGKNSRSSRRISRGGALHRKGERNSRVVPPFQESPRCVSPFQRNLFSLHYLNVQAEDRLPPRVHVGQPCGKASWESLVGKTRGKIIDPLIFAADCVTLLLPLWRKAQVNARIRDED
ncbi:hypothetical protein MJG53_000152 [Ovis ammon polii x Ovis aries]|nr:hypothetical protein MJG53_000152 [Ovis ammon polii x Ovis aries]